MIRHILTELLHSVSALAVEACEIAEQARLIVKENKMEDKIDIIKKTVEV